MQPDAIRRALTENDAALLKELGVDGAANKKSSIGEIAAGSSGSVGALTTRRVSEIEAKPVCWLWHDRIARGKLTIIAGNPGLGKSQITASIAAVVTTGGRWPVTGERCKPGDVLVLSAEDDPADTLRPRLEAAEADLQRVHFVDGVTAGYSSDGNCGSRAFCVEDDLQALGAKLDELGDVAAVVIDPITAYLGDTDSHKNADVRRVLAPVSNLAARHNTAIIAVSHLNKSGGAQALMRVTGSLAFVAAARAAYLVTTDPQNKARRFFLPMKNNLGPDVMGLAFEIEGASIPSAAGPLATSRVCWESEPVSITADEVMEAEKPGNASALDAAVDWLRETLADGPVSSGDIFEQADAAGISKATVRRASNELRIKPIKSGMAGGWSWSLPSKVLNSREDAQEKSLSTFGQSEHLRETAEVEIEL